MKLSSRLRRAALVAFATLALARPALAEDIDIYAGSGDKPNVLIIWDSSDNWSASAGSIANCYYKDNGVTTATGPVDQGSKLGIEQCALYNLVDGLPVKAAPATADNDALFNVAIMLMNKGSGFGGGFPRQAFIALTSNNKAILKRVISGYTKADKSNNADYGQAMYEAYLYYKGLAPLNGNLMASPPKDPAAFLAGGYLSPAVNSCGRNHVIVIGNGAPLNSAPEKIVMNLLAALPANSQGKPNISQIELPLAGEGADNWSDEMARYMRYVDVGGRGDSQGIVTHAIAVLQGPTDGGFPYLMNSIASQGGGSYYAAQSAGVLLKALFDIFNQIQTGNSVFAGSSLPVAANLQGTFENQVFIGMFRPDRDARQRWVGNMKQYQFGIDALDKLFLADSTGAPAIDVSTGFVKPTALSFWSSTSSFWINQPSGTPPSGSDAPDGEVVEKGGAAQRLRTANANSQTSRKVLTCVGCSSSAVSLLPSGATSFDANNTAVTSTLSADLINWVRGADNISPSDERGPGAPTTVRPSIHGDVLHSRPAVVNYGGSTGVVVFYGGNDGMLHAIRGNRSATDGGDELWGFVPEEMFGKLNRLRSNAPEIRFSTTPLDSTATPRDYFVDGPIGVYRKVTAGVTNRVIIYVGMRRGGRQLYAFDVTDPTAPQFLWKKTSASAGMSLLGQTWSAPKVAKVKGHPNPVVVVGAGYDAAAEDASSPGATSMGNAVYVLDAIDGTLLKTFSSLSSTSSPQVIGSSIAADVTLVDSDYDLIVDRAYAVDMGGQVYRIDFEDAAGGSAPANWTIYKLADLRGGTITGRKFLFAPDAVLTKSFVALGFGSGDREKPLLSATQDHFFQIFDRRTMKGAPPAGHAPMVWSDLVAASEVANAPANGCYVTLAQGEKVVNAAASIGGSIYFGTNRPTVLVGSTCSANLGLAKAYEMPLFCVTPSSSLVTGGGLPPGPLVGIVAITYTKADGLTTGTRFKPFVIGAPNARQSGLEVSEPKPPDNTSRKRRYWYQEVNR